MIPKILLSMILINSCFVMNLSAQQDPKDLEVHKLLKNLNLFTTQGIYDDRNFVDDYYKFAKEVPKEVWLKATASIKIVSSEEYVQDFIKTNFTLEELQQINEFYGSQAGKKFQEAAPALYNKFMSYQSDNVYKILSDLIPKLNEMGYEVETLKKLQQDSHQKPNIPSSLLERREMIGTNIP